MDTRYYISYGLAITLILCTGCTVPSEVILPKIVIFHQPQNSFPPSPEYTISITNEVLRQLNTPIDTNKSKGFQEEEQEQAPRTLSQTPNYTRAESYQQKEGEDKECEKLRIPPSHALPLEASPPKPQIRNNFSIVLLICFVIIVFLISLYLIIFPKAYRLAASFIVWSVFVLVGCVNMYFGEGPNLWVRFFSQEVPLEVAFHVAWVVTFILWYKEIKSLIQKLSGVNNPTKTTPKIYVP